MFFRGNLRSTGLGRINKMEPTTSYKDIIKQSFMDLNPSGSLAVADIGLSLIATLFISLGIFFITFSFVDILGNTFLNFNITGSLPDFISYFSPYLLALLDST